MYRRILYINSDKHVPVLVFFIQCSYQNRFICKSGICIEVLKSKRSVFQTDQTSIAVDFRDVGRLVSQTFFIIHYFGSNSCWFTDVGHNCLSDPKKKKKNVLEKCLSCERSIYFYYCRLEAEFKGIDTSRKHTLMNLRTEQHIFKVTLLLYASICF